MGLLRRKNNPHPAPPPPSIQSWAVCWFFLVARTAWPNIHGVDRGGKASFSPFEVGKTSERPFRAKCPNLFCCRLKLQALLMKINYISCSSTHYQNTKYYLPNTTTSITSTSSRLVLVATHSYLPPSFLLWMRSSKVSFACGFR